MVDLYNAEAAISINESVDQANIPPEMLESYFEALNGLKRKLGFKSSVQTD